MVMDSLRRILPRLYRAVVPLSRSGHNGQQMADGVGMFRHNVRILYCSINSVSIEYYIYIVAHDYYTWVHIIIFMHIYIHTRIHIVRI